MVKDGCGNIFRVSKKDSRYINGEFVSIVKGKVMVKDKEGNNFFCFKDDPRYINGDLKSVNSGKIGITNGIINKKIQNIEEIPEGFWRGRTSIKH
jgi:uncharacterized membrane protein